MKTRHPHDGLIAAVRHEPWCSRFADAMAEHVGAACDYFDITSDDITAVLSLHWFQCVWSAVLEDLMARGDDGTNLSPTTSGAAAGRRADATESTCAPRKARG